MVYARYTLVYARYTLVYTGIPMCSNVTYVYLYIEQ